MPQPNVRAVLRSFEEDLQRCSQLVTAVRAAGIPFFQIELVAELSFLRMYVSWESFLEESFARFLCGARCLSGTRPIRFANPPSIEHARSLLIGLDRGGRYADWSKREVVLTRAKVFFRNGVPFATPLEAATRDLDDMRTIRDCIAHRSRSARDSFAKIVHRRMGVAHKFYPGRFLLRTVAGSTDSYLQYFSRSIVLVAEQITA